MITKNIFDNLNDTISKIFTGNTPADIVKQIQRVRQEVQREVQRNVQSVFQSTLERLDIITREEFDSQLAVLERARNQIDKLEIKVTQLEEKLSDLKVD